MKVILKRTVENVGAAGAVVNVKDGFARNYLIARNLAIMASPASMKVYEEEKKQLQLQQAKYKKNAEKLVKDLAKISCTVKVKTGEDDKVFGSVTAANIADLLAEQGFSIDKKKIVLDEPLKALGVYSIPVKIVADVEGLVKVWVVKE
jgi:large subunit ribosomal protein L9